MRSTIVGGHVDLAPTIAELAGLPLAPDWQGRSLFDTARAPRADFDVSGDRFELGVREANWKYILDLREGVEQLDDLDRDPTEQRNLAAQHPERCTRLRQRLGAWTEANRRQYSMPRAERLTDRAPSTVTSGRSVRRVRDVTGPAKRSDATSIGRSLVVKADPKVRPISASAHDARSCYSSGARLIWFCGSFRGRTMPFFKSSAIALSSARSADRMYLIAPFPSWHS